MRSPTSNSDAVDTVDVKLTTDELSMSRRARAGCPDSAMSSGPVVSSGAVVLGGPASSRVVYGRAASSGAASSGAASSGAASSGAASS
eukprot:3861657-Pleurochrysis_carterae.AAC.1